MPEQIPGPMYLKPPREATPEEMEKIYKPMVSPEGLKKLMGKFEPLKNTHYAPAEQQDLHEEKSDLRPHEMPKKVIDIPLSDLKDSLELFTLGPVYYICTVPFDIMAEFHKDKLGANVETASYNVDFDFMPDVPGWGHTIQAVPKEQFVLVRQFINECGFYRKDPLSVIGLYGTRLAVTDTKFNRLFNITVYTPGVVDRWVKPFVDDTGVVRFVNESKPVSFNTRELMEKMKGAGI